MKRFAWIVALFCLAATLSGCGTTVGGLALPRPSDTDPAELVTGPYPRNPVRFTPTRLKVRTQYPALETQRMLDWLVPLTEIDPEMNTNSGVELFQWAQGLEQVMPKYFVPEAERQLFLMGVSTTRTNDKPRAHKRGISMVLRFPGPDFARNAAAGFAQAMKANMPGTRERPDAVPEFPSAITVYNDGSPNITSFLPLGPLLVVINLGLPAPDYPQLIAQVRKGVHAQATRLRDFTPTPPDDILDLPGNADGLLDVALPSVADSILDYVRETEIGVYSTRAALVFARDTQAAQRVFTEAGVDRTARSSGIVYRARDSYGAVQVQGLLGRATHRNDKIISGPPQLADAQCLEPAVRDATRNRRYLCAVSHGRYAAIVYSSTVRDVWQKAAAQYSMLAGRP